MLSLLSLALMDRNFVLVTAFEYLVFTLVYLLHSFTLASSHVIELYIKKVRETAYNSVVGHRNADLLLIKLAPQTRPVVPLSHPQA